MRIALFHIDDYNENGDQQQDKSPEASAPQPQTAASETHETVVRYNPKFAHIAVEPQLEADASEMHETVVDYNRETGEPIIGQIDLDQAPRGAEDTVVRYDEETGEPRLVPAESENKQQQGVRYDEETGEKIAPGKVKKRRKMPKKATEGTPEDQGSHVAASNQAKGKEPPKQEAGQQEANTEPTLKTPPEFTVANDEGAFSAETKPVYSRIYGTKLPRYMIDKTDFEMEFDNFSGQSR
nr:unnamed protein product [Callosobruchus analis]